MNSDKNNLTFAQKMILKKVAEKQNYMNFQDYWVEHEESYNTDYNECNGKYYDTDAD